MTARGERVMLLAIAGISTVALVDALLVGEPDLAALLAAVVVLCSAWLVLGSRERRRLSVRRDLHAWLVARSDTTGEPVDRIADRALATYRLQLDGMAMARDSASTGSDIPASPPGPAPGRVA